MLVDILGAGTLNKGAELMLASLIAHMKSCYPDASFTSEPVPPYYEMHCRYCLYQKIWMYVRGVQIARIGRFVPHKIRRRFGLVTEDEVNVVLDISGFAYGDQWGDLKLKRRISDHVIRWKRQGKIVILLPQAFGPFDNASIANNMRKVIEYADLVFARDKESFYYLNQLTNGSSNIFQAPDFTNLLNGFVPSWHNPEDCRIAFIPNTKMLQMNEDRIAKQYLDVIVSGINQCLSVNKKPFILIHESSEDDVLAKKIVNLLDTDVPVIRPESPLEIKGIIGTCDIVVSSRFHGLVSALSQGVPVIATSWSHKYKELLADYSCSDYLVPIKKEAITVALSKLLDTNTYDTTKQKIEKASHVQKEAAKTMWLKVIDCIQGAYPIS